MDFSPTFHCQLSMPVHRGIVSLLFRQFQAIHGYKPAELLLQLKISVSVIEGSKTQALSTNALYYFYTPQFLRGLSKLNIDFHVMCNTFSGSKIQGSKDRGKLPHRLSRSVWSTLYRGSCRISCATTPVPIGDSLARRGPLRLLTFSTHYGKNREHENEATGLPLEKVRDSVPFGIVTELFTSTLPSSKIPGDCNGE